MRNTSLSLLIISVCLILVKPSQAANVIVNGDFEDGNIGFSSDYQYIGTPPHTSASQITIGTNPSTLHRNYASFGDHTTGTGNMMIVNGSNLPNTTLWQQTIDVNPSTEYNFSAWIASITSGRPATLQFSINSTQIGDIFIASRTTKKWEEFNTTWNSESNTQATVSIVDLNLNSAGNDFALDDISMVATSKPVPEPLSILGSATALGIGGLLKRESSKKQKKS